MRGVPLIVEPDPDDPDCAAVMVDGTIAGRPYRFILDTGAARTQVEADEYTAALSSVALVAYGRADVLVPPAHGDWLAANIPTATTVVSQEGGHLPGDPLVEIAEQMAWLRDGVGPTAA